MVSPILPPFSYLGESIRRIGKLREELFVLVRLGLQTRLDVEQIPLPRPALDALPLPLPLPLRDTVLAERVHAEEVDRWQFQLATARAKKR